MSLKLFVMLFVHWVYWRKNNFCKFNTCLEWFSPIILFLFVFCFVSLFRYTYLNEVGYASPYGYSSSVTPQQTMGYDISADYVDSTTTYEPRSTMIDPDFIGGHSKFKFFFCHSSCIKLNILTPFSQCMCNSCCWI